MPSCSIVSSAPSPCLRDAIIGDYVAWVERFDESIVRRETPSLLVPCVIPFGAVYSLRDALERTAEIRGSLIAGPYDCWVDVRMSTVSVALQVNFSLLGARRLLGCPMHEITNAIIDLPAVMGAEGRQLVEDLTSAPDWPTRFALLDAALVRRWMSSPRIPAAMRWAWTELGLPAGCASTGAVDVLAGEAFRVRPVQEVAQSLGWSNKKFSALVQDATGFTPRRLLSVHRVECATHVLRTRPQTSLSTVAAAVGYADHAHLTRDVVAFTGMTPSRYKALAGTELMGLPLPGE
ncbi:MAG: hypothetical protein C0516_02240 [Gemmatimonas sp.]|nr:hypothetical protein [Gemmatimonas sp.]